MKWWLNLGSYIFHPLWMPFLGSFLYFNITPLYIDNATIKAQLLAIGIITILIPIIFFFMLKNLGLANSIFLKATKSRRLPLLFYVLILLLLICIVLNKIEAIELYYFYVGILIASILCFIFSLFNIKASIHMIGVCGLTLFVIALSIHFNINLLHSITLLVLAMGWTASSRLELKAHNYKELILGSLIGAIPQLLLLQFWL